MHLAEKRPRRSRRAAALDQSARNATSAAELRLPPSELEVGMILQEDVKTDGGMMPLCRGAEVTDGFAIT